MSFLKMDDDVNIYFEDFGEGETLIFCHGLNSSHFANEDFYNEFKDDFRVILYDQRGHGLSDRSSLHMNVRRLGKDLNQIINALDLCDVTLIGHSMGGASIYSYAGQFGCGGLKRIVVSDMSPYMRNDGWNGGIAQGKWSDSDFMDDFDRIFDDVGNAAFHIAKNIMNPDLCGISPEAEKKLIKQYRDATDPFVMASFWYSLFRSDQRPAVSKIDVPFLYIMPEFPLYSKEATDYIGQNVGSDFVLKNSFKDTTHAIWREKPHEVAACVKDFINRY